MAVTTMAVVKEAVVVGASKVRFWPKADLRFSRFQGDLTSGIGKSGHWAKLGLNDR